MTFLDLLKEHAPLISALTSTGMFIIWSPIRVAAIHGAHPAPVGARRTFRWTPNERGVVPQKRTTEQMCSRRQMRVVRKWLDDCYRGVAL